MNDEVHGIWRDAWKEFGSRKVSGKERRVTSDPWGRLTRDHITLSLRLSSLL